MRDRPGAPEPDRPREPEARVDERLRARFSRMEIGADETPPPDAADRRTEYRRTYQENLVPADPDEPRIPREMAGLRGRAEMRKTETGPDEKGPEEAEQRPDRTTDRITRSDAPDEAKLRIEQPNSNNQYAKRWTPNAYDDRALNESDGSRTPLFNGKPRREDVRQGDHGDCGILATMGSVAGTAPDKIRDAIKQNPDGTYSVTLYQLKTPAWKTGQTELTGKKITYTVTPDLPTHNDDGVLAGAKADGVAWPAVLEKAIAGSDQAWSEEERAEWAKEWGYIKQGLDAERIEDGLEPFPDEPPPTGFVRIGQGSDAYEQADLLSALTGREAEVRQLPGTDEELVKALFVNKIAYDKPVLVGSRALRPGERELEHDLVASHAYEVTGLNRDGLIELRNPWGFQQPDPMTPAAFRANFVDRTPDGDRPGLYATLS